MAFTHVQGADNFSGPTAITSFTVTLGAAVTSGNHVLGGITLACSVTNPTITMTVKDDKSNTYTVGSQLTTIDGFVVSFYFYLFNITNGPTTLTATFSASSGSNSYPVMLASEFSSGGAGVSLGPTSSQAQSSVTAVSSGSVTAPSGALAYGLSFSENVGNSTETAGGGWTQDKNTSPQATDQYGMSEYILSTSAGSLAATFTSSASDDFSSFILLVESGTFTVSLSESASAVDTVTETMTAAGTVSESGSAVDHPTATMTATWSLTESGSATDHPTMTMTASWTLSEAGNGVDSPSGLMTASWTIAESDSAVDNLSIPGIAALFEAGNAQDFLTFQFITQVAPPILLSYQYRWGDLFSQWNTGQITVQQYYFSLYALQWYFSGATDWNTSFRPRAAPGDLPAFPLIPPVYVGSSQPTTPTNFAGSSTDRVVDAATLVNTARTLRTLGCPPKAFPAPYPPRWAFQFYGGR